MNALAAAAASGGLHISNGQGELLAIIGALWLGSAIVKSLFGGGGSNGGGR